MKLSTKGRYGLRAIVDLARFSEEEPVSISSISAREDISEGIWSSSMGGGSPEKGRSRKEHPGSRGGICAGPSGRADICRRCAPGP